MDSAVLCPSTATHNTQDFWENAVCSRYWEGSIAVVCDDPKPLGCSPVLSQQLLKGFLQVSRCLFAVQAHFLHVLPLCSYLLYQALLFRLKFLHFLKKDFPIKKTLLCQEKVNDLPCISWAVVALHVHVFSLFQTEYNLNRAHCQLIKPFSNHGLSTCMQLLINSYHLPVLRENIAYLHIDL